MGGGVGVERYEEMNLKIMALLPKVLLHKSTVINGMVEILVNESKTLPVSSVYILYHSGIVKSMKELRKLPTSYLKDPVSTILTQWRNMDSEIPQDVLNSVKKKANFVPHYLKVQGLVLEKGENQYDPSTDLSLVNMEDLCLLPCTVEEDPKLHSVKSDSEGNESDVTPSPNTPPKKGVLVVQPRTKVLFDIHVSMPDRFLYAYF